MPRSQATSPSACANNATVARLSAGALEQQELPDAKCPERAPFHPVERRAARLHGLFPVHEFPVHEPRPDRPVVDAVQPDRAAAGGPHVAGPVRAVPECQRDEERVAGQPRAGRRDVAPPRSPARVVDLRGEPDVTPDLRPPARARPQPSWALRKLSLRGSPMTWTAWILPPRMVRTSTPVSVRPVNPSRAGCPATGYVTRVVPGPQ
jgi:hypothetical protein